MEHAVPALQTVGRSVGQCRLSALWSHNKNPQLVRIQQHDRHADAHLLRRPHGNGGWQALPGEVDAGENVMGKVETTIS